ncbi:hypothetical protein H1O16_gp405 [Burkholderia phage BcepSaruman]|uniref:Uncharacterized protein n=1 Tax=Burkholderia phage BcepSaruman TaxID=2530032 RepID=A0A4D5ZID1_9CAUD|nr:hypothetical protein H1O16_gp405 [Burkholderia phage BcepSaruman]QBX06818.1 hypothetical protein BcepSaruman_405 [Burkholderia phage BcepSaruman]
MLKTMIFAHHQYYPSGAHNDYVDEVLSGQPLSEDQILKRLDLAETSRGEDYVDVLEIDMETSEHQWRRFYLYHTESEDDADNRWPGLTRRLRTNPDVRGTQYMIIERR